MMKATLIAAVLHATAFAAPTAHVLHERRSEESKWVKRDAVAASRELPMRIGLTQNNLDLGHDLLMEVSDPTSDKYGEFYTADEIHELFAPSDESVAAVRAWIEESGIAGDRVSQSVNKQWLQFDALTEEVEKLLNTKFHVYEHSLTGKNSVGCDEYHVKHDVQEHIDYITPGVGKMLELRSANKLIRRSPNGVKGPIKTPIPAGVGLGAGANSLKYCNSIITPNCITAMYNITAAPTTANPANKLGIFEETPEWLDQEDMNLYFSHLAPQIPNGTFPVLHQIDGASNVNRAADAGTEALLDFQISYPIIYPQNSVMFLTDDDIEANTPGLFNTFLDAIDGSYCTYSAFGETGNNNTVDPVYPDPKKGGYKGKLQCGVFKPTNVISFSYELAEFNEGTAPNYQMRQCNEYMKLGMQGVSVVFSSGDAGVGSNWGCAGKDEKVFNPGFPSNCPYVTSVGATTLTGQAAKDQERAVTQFPSGGGFSNYFARPSYQASAVEAYFKSADAPDYPYYTGSSFGSGIYNRSGRGFPDVSAIGQAVVNFGQGEPYLVGGTSASAPTFASILNRINEERLAAGKKSLGFVNPTLYQNPQAFHDITVGSNPNCGSKGFKAAVGWDPLTGLGTPNYPALLDVFMGGAGGYGA